MGGIFNRKLSFEVFTLKEKRWLIDCICETEEQAVAWARKLIAGGKVEAVRIVQNRTMPITGFTTTRIIFEEQAPVVTEKPVVVNEPSGDIVSVCVSTADIYGAPSRRMLATVLRDYFVKVQITPTELLHGWTHVRKLQDNGSILMTAVHRAGSAQARCTASEPKDRINRLGRMVEEVSARARDFAAERKKLPHFDGTDLGSYCQKLRAQVGDEQYDYVFRSMLTAWLYDQRSLGAKLEAVLGLATDGLDPAILQELDSTMADILCFGETIQDLFGAQANMGSFLIALADLLNGRTEVLETARNPALRDIGLRLQSGLLPQCREVLVERLLREVGSDKPLDRNDPQQDQRLLERLAERLKGEDGVTLGGEATEKAIATRKLRLRQNLLRQMGLHSIAENLRPDQA